jgi:hypothetical protein
MSDEPGLGEEYGNKAPYIYCPYEGCYYRENHVGPHSYELEGSEGSPEQGGSTPTFTVGRRVTIETRTRVFFADHKAYLDPSALNPQDKPALCINYGGERGEPLQNARLLVDLEELEEAIKTYKEMNHID